MTARQPLKRGRPPIEGARPWEIEGVSRRTWYRRYKASIGPEPDPIRKAIDRGGGQTCNVEGVIAELSRAGFVIVPRRARTPKRNG